MGEATRKRCVDCRQPKPLDEFHRDRMQPDGRVLRCKDCRRIYRADWYARNRDGQIAYARAWKDRNRDRLPGYGRKYRHGITTEQYDGMVSEQDGRCAICGRDDGDLRVDHCHDRSVIRGLLCDRCNRGLGFFADDPERLAAAAAYVQREGVMPHARTAG